jgi:hypothetical protein
MTGSIYCGTVGFGDEKSANKPAAAKRISRDNKKRRLILLDGSNLTGQKGQDAEETDCCVEKSVQISSCLDLCWDVNLLPAKSCPNGKYRI